MKSSASLILIATCLITGCASTPTPKHETDDLASHILNAPVACPAGLVPSCPTDSLLMKGHNNKRTGCECVSAEAMISRPPF
jgi:hypothetical protein